MRKIPSIMVSQHPDNANKPYWHTSAYISDQFEVRECFLAFAQLGVDEYKWDWEGKFVDESVFERLIGQYASYFKKNPLGKEKFLTFRLPDFRVETEYRLGRALMVIISAAGLAKKLGLHSPPMFEVILPMTNSAQEMIAVEEAFEEIASLSHHLHKEKNTAIKHIEVIPLFESVSSIMESGKIITEYIKKHQNKFKFTPLHIRPYMARSDSALSSGMVSSVLAIKIALSEYEKISQKNEVNIYPILGAGSLPFRGGANPIDIEKFTDEYEGIRTMLAQSAFQYDYPKKDVVKAVNKIHQLLPFGKSKVIDKKDHKKIEETIALFEPYHQQSIKQIGRMVYTIARNLPPRRERLKHTGILKYPRIVNGVKVPRAIGFTASLYSIGIPPEFIGTGRGLKKAISEGKLETVEKYYKNLRYDLERAGAYLNKVVLEKIDKKVNTFSDIRRDIEAVEEFLGHELTPSTDDEKQHSKITTIIAARFLNGDTITSYIEKAARLRRSLG